jgi:hypothetical protein
MQIVEWSPQFSAAIKPALPKTTRQFVKREVKKGLAVAGWVDGLAFVVRPEGNELVIVAAAGRDIKNANKHIYAMAKKQGFTSLRYHTESTAFARLIAKNWRFELVEIKPDEYIFRMQIS